MTTTTWRRSLAALLAAGLLVAGACGGDDDDKSDKSKGGKDQTAANTDTTKGPEVDKDAPDADSKFCKDAIALIQRSMNPNYQSSNEKELAEALKLQPPDEIADAWHDVLTTEQEIEKLDPKDPKSQAKYTAAITKVQAKQAKIISYLTTKCGIQMNPGNTGSGDGSTVTTG